MYNNKEQAQLEAIAKQQRANAIAKADAKSREYFANIRRIYERDLINNIAMKKGRSSYRGVMQTASFMNNYKEVGYTDSQVKDMTETQLLANAIMYNIATSVAGDQISVPKKEAKQAATNAIYALDILSGREDSIDSDYESVLMNLAGVSKHGKYYVRSMIGEEKDVVKQFSPMVYDSFGSADDTRVAGKGVLRANMFTDSFLLKYASTIFESSRTIEGSIEEERMARATGNPMSQRFGDTSHTLMNFTAPALSLVEMIIIGKLTGGAGSAMGLAARGSTLLSRTAIIANSVAKTQYAGRRAEYGLGEEYTTKMKTDDLVFDVVSMWAGMAVTDAVTDMMWSGMFKNAHISSFGKTFSGNMTNRALLKNTAVNVLYGLSNTTLDTAIDYGIYHSFVSLGGEMSISNRQMFDFREGENKLLTFSRSVMKRQVFRTANKIIGSIGSRQRGAADARANKRMLTIAWYNEKKAAENLKNSHPMYVVSMLLNRASFAIFNDTPNRLSTALAMKGLNPEDLAKKIKHLNESSDFRDVSRLFTSLMLDMEARNNAFFTMFYRDPHKLSATGLMNRMINISSETTEHILNIGNAPFLYREPPVDEEFVNILNRDIFAGKNYSYKDKATALEVIKQFSDNRVVVDMEQKELQTRYGATLGQARDILKMEDGTQINIDDIENISKRANLIHKKLFEGSDIESDDANVATIVKDIFKNKEVGLMEPTDSFSNSVRLFAKLARDIHDGVEGLGDERAAMLDRFITTFSNPNVNEREAYTGIDMLIKDYFGLDMKEFGKMSDAIGKIVEDEVIKTGIDDFATINALIKTTKNKVVDTLIHKVSGMLSGKSDFSTIEFLNSMNQLQSLLHVVNVADLRVVHKEFMNQLADSSTYDKVKELFKLTNREDIETIASVLRRFTGVANTLEKNGAINEVYNVVSELEKHLVDKRFKGLQLAPDEKSQLKWIFRLMQEGTSTDIVKDDIDITINGKQKVEVEGTHETFNAVLSAVTGKEGIGEFEMDSYKALYAALSKKYVRETVAVRILEDKAELSGIYNSDEDITIRLPLGNVVYNVKRNAVDVTMDRDIGPDALLKGLAELYAKISLKPLEMITKGTNSTINYNEQSTSVMNIVSKTKKRLVVGSRVLTANEVNKALNMIPGFRQLINELSLEGYVTKNYNSNAGDIDVTRIEQVLHRALRTHEDTIAPKDKEVIRALLNDRELLVPRLAEVMYMSDISRSVEETLAMKGDQDRIILNHSISSMITDIGYLGTYRVFSVSPKLLSSDEQASITTVFKAIGASQLPVSGSTGDKVRWIMIPKDEKGQYSAYKISKDMLNVMMKSSNITKSQEDDIYAYMASNGSSGEFKFSESGFNLMSTQLRFLEIMVNHHVNKSKSSGSPHSYLKELNEDFMDALRDPDFGGFGKVGDVLSTYIKDRRVEPGKMFSEVLQEFRLIDSNVVMESIKDHVYNLKEVKEKYRTSYNEDLAEEIDNLIASNRYIINKKDIANSFKVIFSSRMKNAENLMKFLSSIESQLTGLDSGTRAILETLRYDRVRPARIDGSTIMSDFISLTKAYDNEYANSEVKFAFKDFLKELDNKVGQAGMKLLFEGGLETSLAEIDSHSYNLSAYETRFNNVNSEKENYGSVAEILTLFQSSGLNAVEDPLKYAKRASSVWLASNAPDALIKRSVDNFTEPMVIRIIQSADDYGKHTGPPDGDGEAYYGKEFAPFFNGLTGSDRSTGKSVVNGFFGLFKNNAAYDASVKDNEMTMNIHNAKHIDRRFIENAKNKGLLVEKDGGRNIVITLTTKEDKEAFLRSIRLHQEIESKATTTDILDQSFVSVFSVMRPTTSLSDQSIIEFIYGAQDMSDGSYIHTMKRYLTTFPSPSVYAKIFGKNETRPVHPGSKEYKEALANKLKSKDFYDGIELAESANKGVAVSSGSLLELAVKRQEESYNRGERSRLEKYIVKLAEANRELKEYEVVEVIRYLVDKGMISLVKNNETKLNQMFIGFNRAPNPDDSHYVAYPITEIFSNKVPQLELTRAAAGDQHADFDGDTAILFGVSNTNLRKYVTEMSDIVSKKLYDEAPLVAIHELFTEISKRNNMNRTIQSFYNRFDAKSFIGESNTKRGSLITKSVFDVINLVSANSLSGLKLFGSGNEIPATLTTYNTIEGIYANDKPYTDKDIEDIKEYTFRGTPKPIDRDFVNKVVLYNDKTASLDNKKDIMPLGSFSHISTREIDYGSEDHRAIVRLVKDYEGSRMVIVAVKKRSSLDETILDIHTPREFDNDESMTNLYNELTAKGNMESYLGREFGMKSFQDKAEPYRLATRKKYRTQLISFDNHSRIKMATFGSVANKVDAAFTSTTSVTPMDYGGLSKQDVHNYMTALFVGANVDITTLIPSVFNRGDALTDFSRVDNIEVLNSTLKDSEYIPIGSKYAQNLRRLEERDSKNPTWEKMKEQATKRMLRSYDDKVQEEVVERIYTSEQYKRDDPKLRVSNHVQDSIMRGEIAKQREYLSQFDSINKLMDPTQKAITREDITAIANVINGYNLNSVATIAEMKALPAPLRSALLLGQRIVSLNTLIGSGNPGENKTLQGEIAKMLPETLSIGENISHILKMYSLNMQEGEEFSVIQLLDEDNKTIMRNAVIAGRFVETMEESVQGFYEGIKRISDDFNANVYFRDEGVEDMNSLVDAVYTKIQGYNPKVDNQGNFIFARDSISALFRDLGIELSETHDNVGVFNTGLGSPGVLRSKYLIDKKSGNVLKREALFNKLKYSMEIRDDEFIQSNKQMIFSALRDLLDGDSQSTLNLMDSGLNRKSVKVLSKLFKESHGTFEFDPDVLNKDLTDKYLFMSDENLVPNLFHDTTPLIENLGRVDLTKMTPDC